MRNAIFLVNGSLSGRKPEFPAKRRRKIGRVNVPHLVRTLLNTEALLQIMFCQPKPAFSEIVEDRNAIHRPKLRSQAARAHSRHVGKVLQSVMMVRSELEVLPYQLKALTLLDRNHRNMGRFMLFASQPQSGKLQCEALQNQIF